MLSGISKQQVVRCASLSVSVHQHQSAPNMTITDKQTHITCYIKVRVNFQVKAHQSLYTTLWHVQNCCCFLCLLKTLMHPDLSLQALHAQVYPTCMVTLGWWWLIPDHWFTQRSTHHHPSDRYRITTGTYTAYKTQCLPLDSACMCQKPFRERYQSPGKIPNIKLKF